MDQSLRRILLCMLLPCVIFSKNFAQKINVDLLEKEVYTLNNNLQFNKSQALLFKLLEEDLSAEDKYQINLLLSYTYKRLFDYESALKFLQEASIQAAFTTNKEEYTACVLAEVAIVYFDVQDYTKSAQIMDNLAATGYRHISEEDKSKLVMQQGYLCFLKKEYNEAEILYDQSIDIIKKINPCDLPMVLVKKMQLYNAMERSDLVEEVYQQSSFYSDSCDIIKYDIYAKDELISIYAVRQDYQKVGELNSEVDSLNNIYKKEKYLSGLHNSKEQYYIENKNKEINEEKKNNAYLWFGLAALGIFLIIILSFTIYYRRKKRSLEKDFSTMKEELSQYMVQAKTSIKEQEVIANVSEALLSSRQKQVLELLIQGKSNKEIATTLFISENTVKYHIKIIYQHLNIKGRHSLFKNQGII